jgi:Zn-dependent metalloprotease
MNLLRGKATYLVAGLAVVVSVTGAAAVQAQPSANNASSGKVGTAEAAVNAHSNRFGFGPGQALQVKAVYTDRLGSTVRFDRTYRGLPVIGGDFLVHGSPSGAYRYGNGMKVVGLPASIRASVSAAAASKTAAAKVGYAVAKSTSSLVILSTQHSSSLAWQVATTGKTIARGDVTYVSATNGRTLASWPTVMNDDEVAKNDTGTGKTLWLGTVKLKDVKNNSKYSLIDNTRGKAQTLDANNSNSEGVGTLFTDKNNIWGNGKTTSRESAGADAAFGVAKTWDFYLDTFKRRGIADDGKAARAFVHVSTNYRNAFWSDGCFCMEFGDGSGDWGPLVTLDVAGHEMSHGVTSRTAGLIYSGESGGLNESTSDVMGTSVEFYANNSKDVGDYIIGEQFQIPYDPANNYLRRLDHPSVDGGSKDCWYDGVGNTDVHYSSGVGNHAFYLLSEGSGKKTINGIKYDSPTCNGKSVDGIGRDKAAAIWYRALTHEWISTTNYHQARVGMLNAAKDLYGQNSKEYKATNAAWAAVAVKG